MNEKVLWVQFNWFYTEEAGEQYSQFSTSQDNIKSIKYNSCFVEGDKHYCDVYFTDGTQQRVFNINMVGFDKKRIKD